MLKMEMRFNGRKVTSAAQIEHELKRSIEEHVHDSLKRAVGSGMQVKRTRNSFVAEGMSDQIERMKKRLRQSAR